MVDIFPFQPKSDKLVHQLESFYRTFKNVDAYQKVHFNLSQVSWFTPLMLLPISAHISDTKSVLTLPDNVDTSAYLRHVAFPDSVDSVNNLQRDKGFIPLSIIRKGQSPESRNEMLYCFSSLVYKTIQAVPGTKDAFFYPLTELVGNIFEHSNQNYGFVFGQIYSKKGYLDLCILDRGRGLAQSYAQEQGKTLSHSQAILHAMRGDSTKDDVDRGFGVNTSKTMVCQGFHGEFTLISGNACLVSNCDGDKIFTLPQFDWQGVVLAYRIPFPKKSIDWTMYVE